LVARRPWPAHPRCGCHWPPSSDPAPHPLDVPTTPGAPVAHQGE
jgi:hypothetical protein